MLAPLSTDGAISDGLREGRGGQPARRHEPGTEEGSLMNETGAESASEALIVLQIVIYGYLFTMFCIQLYMSFARGWWDL